MDAKLLEYLQRLTFAVERIANVIVPEAEVPAPAPLRKFPIIDGEPGARVLDVAGPRVQRSYGRHCHAVCLYCPARQGQPADPQDPWTWLEYDGPSADLDTQRAALQSHDEHHRRQLCAPSDEMGDEARKPGRDPADTYVYVDNPETRSASSNASRGPVGVSGT